MESLINLESNSIPQSINLTANFAPEVHSIDLNVSEEMDLFIFICPLENHSTLFAQIPNIDSETQIMFEAYPSEGWSFSNWSGLPDLTDKFILDDAEVNQYSPLSYFFPTKDLNIEANFVVSKYTIEQIKVNVDSTGGGNVQISKEADWHFLHFGTHDEHLYRKGKNFLNGKPFITKPLTAKWNKC